MSVAAPARAEAMSAHAAAAPAAPTAAQAFRYWLKLGFISFGGPAGQIAIMHHDLVDRKRWISEQRFLHTLNYCMILPGPEATQLATYIGWILHRTWGGVIAGTLFVLPSLGVLIALSWLYMAYGEVPAVAGVLYGIKPAVVAIVLHAAWPIGSRALRRPTLWTIAAAAFVAIFAFRVPFPAIVLAAGIVGFVGGWTKAVFGPGSLALAGIAAACVATFFTFLPSFLFILAGGPLIETTHGQFRFTAPLSGITAAVVGVIVNLAVFFAWHVFWPHGWDAGGRLGGLDAASPAIGLAAAVALFRFKAGVIPVILACGAAGLAARLAGVIH